MASDYQQAMQGIISNSQNERKLQAFLQQITEQNQDRQEQRQAQARAAEAWAKQADENATQLAPPPNPNTPDSSPPPGQASQPMIPPPPMNAQAMPHPAAMPGMAGGPPPPMQGQMPRPQQGPPAPPPMPNQMAQPQVPPPPQGWKPSPSAPPALGGAPSGTPPQAGPPAGNSIAPPPTPAAQPPQPQAAQAGGMPAAPGEPPPIMGVQMPMSGPKFVQAAMKGGATPLQAYQAYMQYKPMADQQEGEYMDAFRIQAETAQRKVAFSRQADQDALRERHQQELERHNRAMEPIAQERADRMANRAGGAKGTATGGPAGPTKPLDPVEQQALDTDSWNFINKGILPNRKGKGGGDDYNTKVRMNAAKLTSALGMSPEEAASQTGEWKANAMALNASTKDLAAIRPFKEMLDTNADIAIDLGKKLARTDSALANRSINWVQQNIASNPDASEYLAQIKFVQTEAARVLNNPRLVGQLTDSARNEMEDVVNGNMPIASTERVLNRIKKDGENRVAAMQRTQDALKNKMSGKKTDKPSGEAKTVHWDDLK